MDALFLRLAAAAAWAAVPAAVAQSACSPSCSGTLPDGTTFNLSALMGTDFQTRGADSASDTYFLNVCGTSQTVCANDQGSPPVTQGSAVTTVDGGGCYVLGVYTGNNCLWGQNPNGKEGIELVLDDGSNALCSTDLRARSQLIFCALKLAPAPSFPRAGRPSTCRKRASTRTLLRHALLVVVDASLPPRRRRCLLHVVNHTRGCLNTKSFAEICKSRVIATGCSIPLASGRATIARPNPSFPSTILSARRTKMPPHARL